MASKDQLRAGAPMPPCDPACGARFGAAGLVARSLRRDEVPALQALFDANPAYFELINGRRALADEAAAEFDELPPPHLSHGTRWLLGVYRVAEEPAAPGHSGATDARHGAGKLAGVIDLVEDLCTAGAWHIGLFWLETALHGRGAAAPLHAALRDWARARGAAWLRLMVVIGNQRAEAFWERQGYTELRRRHGIDTGGRLNDARVMLLPLREVGIAVYLERVPRDRPDAPLP